MDKFNFAEWRKERDEAVSALDVDKLKKFYLKWQERGVYNKGPVPSNAVIEIAMYKMALEITTIDPKVKERAAAWLLARKFTPGIRWEQLE